MDGGIIDLSGAEVSPLTRLRGAADNVMMWDGRDSTGHIVRAGVYIYKIRGEGKTFSGSVVVAK